MLSSMAQANAVVVLHHAPLRVQALASDGCGPATPEGDALYAEVQRTFKGLEELDRVVAQLRGFNAARLQIGSLHALSGHLLPQAVREFRETYPEIRIGLQVQSSNTVRDMVLAGRLDLGIVADESRTEGLRSSPS